MNALSSISMARTGTQATIKHLPKEPEDIRLPAQQDINTTTPQKAMMKHKISTGTLIFKDDKILLVKHVHPESSYEWRVPPGGGLKGMETLKEAAEREVKEEAGLDAKAGKLVYLRQFLYTTQQTNVMTVYMLAETADGNLTTRNLNDEDLDSQYIKEAKYFSKEELQDINVFPTTLKNEMWEDRKQGFPEFRFLSVTTEH